LLYHLEHSQILQANMRHKLQQTNTIYKDYIGDHLVVISCHFVPKLDTKGILLYFFLFLNFLISLTITLIRTSKIDIQCPSIE